MYKAVVCARKQFFRSKKYVGFVHQFSPSVFSFYVHVVFFLSQPVRYRTRLVYSSHYQAFTNVTSINLLV